MKYHMLYPFDQWVTADEITGWASDAISNALLKNTPTADTGLIEQMELVGKLHIPPPSCSSVADAMEILHQVGGAEFSTERRDQDSPDC